MTKPDRGVIAFVVGALLGGVVLAGLGSLIKKDPPVEDFSRGSALVEGKSCVLTLPNGTKVKGAVFLQQDGSELCTTFPPLISGANDPHHKGDGKRGKKGPKSLGVITPNRLAFVQQQKVCESNWASLLDETSQA